MGRIQAATEILRYKWHPEIIYTVYELEGAGYSELDATLDEISSKMLSDGLLTLCERNILEKTETVEDSGRMIYALSDKGHALIPVLDALDAWNQRYQDSQSSVLILEDERMVASILADYVSSLYDIQYVRTGERALETYTEDTDVVIIDRKLDSMSGGDVAARIGSEHEQQLIMFVSGVEPGDDLCELECDDYIHKPVEEDEMKARLELLLNRAELDPTAKKYLSLRSKQIALIETHGQAAKQMIGYRDCTARIEELGLSTDRKRTLEPLLPSTAGESDPLGE